MQCIYKLQNYTSYDTLIEKIKLTPRIWNNQSNLGQFLRHVSWILHIDINLIGFKRTGNFLNCSKHSTSCFFPYFVFQNTLIKYSSQTHASINIIQMNSKLYLYDNSSLEPILINLIPKQKLMFQNTYITDELLLKIINNDNQLLLPFNVKLYSSYCYIKHQSIKKIQKNIVASYCSGDDSHETLHLFISPSLTAFPIKINILDIKETTFYTKNVMCSISHLPEGENRLKRAKTSVKNKELNQEHCICDHPQTQRVFLSSAKISKPLGKKLISVSYSFKCFYCSIFL